MEAEYASCQVELMGIFLNYAEAKLTKVCDIMSKAGDLLRAVKRCCQNRDLELRIDVLLNSARILEEPIDHLTAHFRREEEMLSAAARYPRW
ncbi:hypothetical protein RRF57_002680 [Xylaria bambusicola]|uniref:Uncharacterized protein n=1 Tax=Xylaria bambusicola TaxID=326684 RepID=A0AAN7U7C3_9PEZI